MTQPGPISLQSSDSRAVGLDVLRVVAITTVIGVLHSSGYLRRTSGFALGMPEGVSNVVIALALGLTTCISGYVIASKYTPAAWPGVGVFLRRRVTRVYPLYALALTVFWLAWFESAGVVWAALQYVGVGVLVSGLGFPLVATLYYVQISLLCYVGFAAIASLPNRHLRVAGALLALVALYVWCAVLGFGDERLMLYVPSFVFGVAVARIPGLGKGARRLWALTALATVLVAVAVVQDAGAGGALPLAARVVLPLLAFGPAWMLADFVANLVPASVLAAASYASYCAYLFHRVVFSVMERLVPRVDPVASILLFVVLGTVLSFGVGFVIQRLYDRSIALFERSMEQTSGEGA